MCSFSELATTRLGFSGEDLCKEYFKIKKYEVKEAEKGPHLIDFELEKNGKNILCDIKTKPHRIFYQDTGFDMADYITYKRLQKITGKKVLIVFVDYYAKSVYGNYLDSLDKYKKYDKKIVYFSLNGMRKLFDLSDESIKILRNGTTANMKYLDKMV
jgi:hypothetical protein